MDRIKYHLKGDRLGCNVVFVCIGTCEDSAYISRSDFRLECLNNLVTCLLTLNSIFAAFILTQDDSCTTYVSGIA
jgi:hypothetical protein